METVIQWIVILPLTIFLLVVVVIIRTKISDSRITSTAKYTAALGKILENLPHFKLHLDGEYAGLVTCDCPHCNGKPFACLGNTKCIHCDHLIGITPAEAALLASAPKYFG